MASVDFSRFVGLEYEERGQGPERFDCWGLLRAAFEAGTGLSLAVFDPYARPVELSPAGAARASGIALAWRPLEAPVSLQAFDAVVMVIRGRYHVGLMVDSIGMLHIQRDKTSVIEPASRYRLVTEDYMRHERLF